MDKEKPNQAFSPVFYLEIFLPDCQGYFALPTNAWFQPGLFSCCVTRIFTLGFPGSQQGKLKLGFFPCYFFFFFFHLSPLLWSWPHPNWAQISNTACHHSYNPTTTMIYCCLLPPMQTAHMGQVWSRTIVTHHCLLWPHHHLPLLHPMPLIRPRWVVTNLAHCELNKLATSLTV